MNRHLIQRVILDYINPTPAKFNDLKFLIRDSELDILISEKFPLNSFDLESKLLINGSKDLIMNFETVDEDKMDIIEELKNIEYIGFSEDEIILRIKSELFEENATAVYNFTNDFFESVFNMGKFSKYCISNAYYELLKENITYLTKRNPSLKRQYRLIYKNNVWFLRGITSTRYNNYDNHLAIYLTLISLHKYSLINNTEFNIEKAYLTDSEIHIFFEQPRPIKLSNSVEIYFGFYLSNSEIREAAFSLELRYKVINEHGKQFSGLSNYVFNINHSTSIKNIEEKLFFSDRINEIIERVVQLIISISNQKLTENQIYLIFKRILSLNHKLSKETRENANNYQDTNIINNSLTIIEAYDKLNEITTDVDEIIYLERIYDELLKDIIIKKRRK